MSKVFEHLENEWFVVRYSGEIPEIAYHSSVYFLTKAKDGPRLAQSEIDFTPLLEAARERFREIILRDILPENRNTAMYRGVKRTIVNYQRFQKFCKRQGLDEHAYANEVAVSLLKFLEVESVEVTKGSPCSAVNCTFEDLNEFAVSVGLVSHMLPEGIAQLCEEKN